MGYQSFYPFSVSRVQGNFLVEKTLHPLGFTAAQVAFATFSPHDFATTGNMEATLCPFMRFQFRHLEFPSSLPLVCFSTQLLELG